MVAARPLEEDGDDDADGWGLVLKVRLANGAGFALV